MTQLFKLILNNYMYLKSFSTDTLKLQNYILNNKRNKIQKFTIKIHYKLS